MSEKEFGKLSRQHLRDFYAYYYQSNVDKAEFSQLVIENNDRVREIVRESGAWGCLYDFPERTIALLFLQITNLLEGFIEACQSADPVQGILDFLASDSESLIETEDDELPLAFTALMPLFGNMTALEQYGESISSLLLQAREGDDEALLKAVRIDRACVSSDVVSERVCVAHLQSDESFMNGLAKSLTLTKPVRPKPHLDEAKFFLSIIDESIGVENLSYKAIQEILIDDLKLIDDKNGGAYQSIADLLKPLRKKARERNRDSTLSQ